MNEFGVDTAFANYLTQTAVDNLDFFIGRITDLGAVGSGTSAYYNKTINPDAACYPNMKLVQTDNNKPAGMYFFSHAWNAASAAFEANSCCDWLDTWNFNPKLGVFLDFERLAPSGRVGSFENLIYILGGQQPSASLMQSIVSSWCSTIKSRGYKPGFYMNMDPINATTNAWIQTNRFNDTLGSPYFWLAQWASTNSWDCDIWQYYAGSGGAGTSWNGITVDYDKCMNDRIFSDNPPTPPVPASNIPIWLMLKMARGENNGKHTVLL